VWKQVAADVVASKPVESNQHEDLILDAIDFQRSLRFEIVVLYAAFAAEIILRKVCTNLQNGKEKHISRRRERALEHMGMLALINQVEDMLASKLPTFNWKKVRELSTLRNRIAHGKDQLVTAQQADEAIRVANKLKEFL
jgi:hypothetical protein